MVKKFITLSTAFIVCASVCVSGFAAADRSDKGTSSEPDRNLLCYFLDISEMSKPASCSSSTKLAMPAFTNLRHSDGSPALYVAMGDSIAAGSGLPLAADASPIDKRCGRTPYAYANEVAAKRHMKLLNISCSGAKTEQMFSAQSKEPVVAPQLKAAYSQGNPDLITLTIGANDIRWTKFLGSCFRANCATDENTVRTNVWLLLYRFRLQSTLQKLQERSPKTPPLVIVTGYYNPVSMKCANIRPELSTAEVEKIIEVTDALNETIKSVSRDYVFVRYAPVDFSGHDICSAHPWVHDNKKPGPLHPNAAGEQAMGRAVLNALNDYTYFSRCDLAYCTPTLPDLQ